MSIHWFPGHMARTLREMREQIRAVDLIVETCDARIPAGSRNPELARLAGDKPRLIFLSKADLADPAVTEQWLQALRTERIGALAGISLKRSTLAPLVKAMRALVADKTDRALARGRIERPVKVLVAGIPNTGKSTLINALCGRKAADTEDRPGVTRQLRWIRAESGFMLLDSPGVLWPKPGSRRNQLHLAATGAIRDEVLPIEEVASETLAELLHLYPDLIQARYGELPLDEPPEAILAHAARRRGCLLTGGRTDNLRFSIMFLDEFRAGTIGRMSLERPKG